MHLKVNINDQLQVGLVRKVWRAGEGDSALLLFLLKREKNPEVLGWTNL